jgi:hypothetical protein
MKTSGGGIGREVKGQDEAEDEERDTGKQGGRGI